MPRLYFALDLADDAELIARYDWFHQPAQARAAVTAGLRASGIRDLEIHRVANRLVMVIEAGEAFDPARKAALDAADPEIVRWEAEMDRFQRPILGPGAPKWAPMQKIYSLRETTEFHGGAAPPRR